MSEINQGSLWRFVGEGEGRHGEIHLVTSSDGETVTTWGAGGWSWMGGSQEFRQQFKFVQEKSK